MPLQHRSKNFAFGSAGLWAVMLFTESLQPNSIIIMKAFNFPKD